MPSFADKVTRFGFSRLGRISPELASQLALTLFCRTPAKRPKVAKAKATFAEGARKLAQAEKILVQGPEMTIGVQRIAASGCSAPRVLVIHGWGSRAEYLADMALGLRDAGAEVFVVDLPGHGRSSGRRLDMRMAAEAMATVQERFGPFDAAVGHSFGGAALMTAAGGSFPGIPALYAGRLAVIGSPSRIEDVFDGFSWMVGLTKATQRALVDRTQRLVGCGVDALDCVPIALRLGKPLLVVHAEDDKEVSAAQAKRYVGVSDLVRHYWANGQGHRRIVSAPGVISEVSAFLLSDHLAVGLGNPLPLRAASSY
ncbi:MULTISPECIES: alpha/beta hydrolase [Alphaproteobacteria]|uniref:Alpha/beta hydrolase n=2 Tax=Alphaproteobacteria TaxID=28211 RepID=A0A512HCD8_9HYPH|nr:MULTISPECIES: alpha/beta hydrolase family protein [Alphaproteobacteria]GEO83111.1 alpha/beta hydrolase [Ciceribacter naphthalenivorans]GLR20493.1 alpha/beta hydrolase [Ciceribacter naphthalenivorans]GLT03349.1 alpha/beta hydrolase [Sphingomonas psychrolutea]